MEARQGAFLRENALRFKCMRISGMSKEIGRPREWATSPIDRKTTLARKSTAAERKPKARRALILNSIQTRWKKSKGKRAVSRKSISG